MNNPEDFVTIPSRWGRIPVHKHWLDPVEKIIARYNRKRQEGTWRQHRGEWVFTPYRDQQWSNR